MYSGSAHHSVPGLEIGGIRKEWDREGEPKNGIPVID